MRKTIFLILVISTLIFCNFGAAYAYYIITNTQSFNLSRPEKIDQNLMGNSSSYSIDNYERQNLTFPGAPSSIMLEGSKWVFSGVEYDGFNNLWFRVEAYAQDGLFSDCITCGTFSVRYSFGPDSFYPPLLPWYFGFSWGPTTLRAEAGSVFETCHDRDEYEASMHIPFHTTLLGDIWDLSVFDVEEFTVQLERDLHMAVDWRDTNDTYNWMDYESEWNGSITINYLYSQVPIPGTVWLLASGLIGLVGIRRKFRKN